jgi:hypothetical protein
MYHVEMRMGAQVARQFNLSEQQLDAVFLSPLMADRDFKFEGHDWIPRSVRLKIYEGPQLEPHELGMGRGWQNVERSGSDVTQALLQRARGQIAAKPVPAAAGGEVLRERLIGRLSAGPMSLDDVVEVAAGLMPDNVAAEQLAAGERAALELLRTGAAQLSGR